MFEVSLRLRRRLGQIVADAAWHGASSAARRLPRAQPKVHGVERVENVSYGPLPEHRLDVYRPLKPGPPKPSVLYVHGGSFRILSKSSHFMMALAFARRGHTVFTIDYRLAPKHPFPAAIDDAARALTWLSTNGRTFGADPTRVVLAGESAGANLVTSLAIACCWERPEPFARALFDASVQLEAVLPTCGILQVTDVARYMRGQPLNWFIADRLNEVEEAYLRDVPMDARTLADPLTFLETASAPARALPPFFAGVGTADVLQADTHRLDVALQRLGAKCVAKYYPGEPHAFHALVFRKQAKQFWLDTFAFLQSVEPE